MELFVHDGEIQDPDGGRDVLQFGKAEHPRLEKVWADARYEGGFVEWALARDYEELAETAEAWMHLAMSRLYLRRLAADAT